jgi:predicted kinase
MRRLPDDRRLSTLVLDGRPVHDALRMLARRLAALHASDASAPTDPIAGSPGALRDLWLSNLAVARRFVGTVLDPVTYDDLERLSLRYVDGREPLLARRVADGWIRDGHGDLEADDVFCLDDGPRALDCIEFDDALRHVDGIDDAAFLAMDLERLGAPELGKAFLAWYAEFRADPAPPSLAHHYVAYRASVRVKVTCLRHEQGDPESAETARRLSEVCRRHLRAAAVRLVLVGGAPGTGKSTLAAGLAERLGWVVLRSDVVRKELAGLAPSARGDAALYTPEMTGRTYDELQRRAEALLGQGESVVLDASWTRASHRAAAAEVAGRTVSDLVELRCAASPETARARVAERLRSDRDASDADAGVADRLAAEADPWPTAVVVDTEGPVEASVRAALAWVAPDDAGDVILVP